MKNRRGFINLLLVLFFLFGALGVNPQPAEAISSGLRISQVYGAGGNSGAVLNADYIEIFNAGDTALSLDGLSLQYASATGTGNFGSGDYQLTELPNVMVQPGQYFLVQEAGGANGVALPTPDHIDPTPIAIAATAGKIALVNSTTTLGCNGSSTPCNASQLALIIDLVGFGTANFYEGTAAAPAISTTTAAFRASGGCVDTDDNGADFTAEAPAPRNTASPTNLCATVIRPTELFFSEYLEGSSNNKALEIYNGTGADVDLSDYQVFLYSNGSVTPGNTLSWPAGTMLADGDVYVIANASADPVILAVADITSTVTYFNGDDALELRKLSTASPVDVIGRIGEDPGTYWGVIPNTTAEYTLVRMETICQGDTDPYDPFDPADEWIAYPQNTFTYLGAHTTNCALPAPGITVVSTSPADGAIDVALDANITITFSEPVTLTDPWFDITCTKSGVLSAIVIDTDPVFTLDPVANLVSDEVCTVTVFASGVAADSTEEPIAEMAADYSFSFSTVTDCGDTFTPIYDIQGSGLTTPLAGQKVTTEGIVVGDFQVEGYVSGTKNGFYLQDPTGDGDTATSDGIFVYYYGSDVQVGDHVRVAGEATEYYGLTQIGNIDSLQICDVGQPLPSPTPLSLPVSSLSDFEPFESMLVTFPQDLVISEYFNYDRYGEIVLTSIRQVTPTALVEPGPDATALADEYLLDRITLDDGRTSQNPDPAIHPNGLEFSLYNRFRGGDLVTNLTGVLDYSYNLYRIQATQGADYTALNLRTPAPDIIAGDIKVASLNVLNYFTTLDNAGWICGPSGDMECRGADNQEELDRQRAKILAALSAMDADVVGLIEIENDRPGLDPDYPVADLVNGLNDIMGAGTYDYIPTGPIGTDAIKVALIYKPVTVTPIGDYAILDETVDARFLDDYNRPALAQTFKSDEVGEAITVAVNHLKSKGSSCDAIGDPDLGDGAGNCNLTRLAAAQAEVDWLASDPTGTGVERSLIIGDLNSYDKEAPITAIKDGSDDLAGTGDDYFDLILDFLGEDAYSYVFNGQVGYLDYALANANLLPFVTDVDVWHINADEPDLLDYDTSFKLPAQDAIFAPDAYRASDHDPVLVTLTFNKQPIAMDDFYETDQDVTLLVDLEAEGVLANDYDLNVHDVIRLDVITQPAHGTLTLNQDGTFEYIPDLRFFGEDHFEYLLIALPPGRAEYSDTAIVTITVHPKYQYYMPINFGR